MRFVFSCALLLAAGQLAAFFAQPAGFSINEYPQAGGSGGITWDPAGSDFYASNNGGIRRFNTSSNSYEATALFAAPASIPPAAYAFFDSMAIDPANPDDFYVSYSGHFSRMHKLLRTGPDAATLVTSADYDTSGLLVYQLAFVPDLPTVPAALRGQLVCTGAAGFGAPAKIWLINKTTLAATELADVGSTDGSGPLAIDDSGNFYTARPPVFTSFTGVELVRFPATALAAAIGGAPVAATQATVLLPAGAAEWNVTSLAVRSENGGTFLYYGTLEHASIKRHCLETGEVREFIRGFGGVSEGYQHFAQGGALAFSSRNDDFAPASGGNTRLAVTFSVFTPGFGSYRSIFVFAPEPVNFAVASLHIISQPAAISNGVPFSITLEARNSGGTPILSNVAVALTVNGSGVLDGFTVVSRPGNALLVDGLVYAGAPPETITLTARLCGAPGVSVTTTSISVVAPAANLAAVPPAEVKALTLFSLSVQVRDGTGGVIVGGPDSQREVTLSLQSGPHVLLGGGTVTASNGVATFNNLVVGASGSYVLRVSSPGLPDFALPLTAGTSPKAKSSAGGNGTCTTGEGAGWCGLAALLAVLVVALRLRRSRV